MRPGCRSSWSRERGVIAAAVRAPWPRIVRASGSCSRGRRRCRPLAAPAGGRGPCGHAGPDDRHGCPLRRPARQQRVRVSVDMTYQPPARHARPGATTSSVRSSRSCPARRLQAHLAGREAERGWPFEANRPTRFCGSTSGAGSSAASADLKLASTCPTRAARRRASSGSATRSCFPVWSFASESTPGSTVTVVFPPATRSTVESGDLRRRDRG